MLVQYCSDLHLEFPANELYLKKNPLLPTGEILLLGDDILPLKLDHAQHAFFNYVSDNFEMVYWIPGNHEFYGSDLATFKNPHHEKIRRNVLLVNNIVVQYKSVDIICSTLWSHIDPIDSFLIQRRLTDFYAIQSHDQLLTVEIFNQQHDCAVDFLKESFKTANKKSIVLTHHIPTFQNYPSKYKNSPVNQGFATELHDVVERSAADFWLYGHHHFNRVPFKVGNTTLLTNQLGYVSQHEQRKFSRVACFDI